MKEPKSVAVSFRVSPRFKRCLAEAASHERHSQTNLLEHLLFSYCDANGLGKRPTLGGARKANAHKNAREG
jgi:hypothetical protein